jgi:hypothetical protein
MTHWRTLSAILLGAGACAGSAPAALADPPATPPRADSYYVVMCIAPGSTEPAAYERVDAHAVEVGNKDDQVAAYGAHHPGWTCWVVPGS